MAFFAGIAVADVVATMFAVGTAALTAVDLKDESAVAVGKVGLVAREVAVFIG